MAFYEQDGGRYTVKQIEKTRKTLQTRLEKLNQKEKKDQVVTFEELGVDHLYVDEAHSYKNAFLYTKMRNVAGIAQNEAQKSADMFNKCQYLDEITGGKGITFATGTPISNSMTELYVMQLPFCFSCCKLFIRNLQFQFQFRNIDADDITFLNKGDGTAYCCLR